MRAQEYDFIKHKVRKLIGMDLNFYKSAQMQRRLKTYLLRSGHANWANFFRAIQSDPTGLGKLRDYLTINVTAFFRDPQKFERLRTFILPELLRERPRLRVWSAGCSQGHEPYSLAMLLVQASGLDSRHLILGTDIDHSALVRARAGGPYPADSVAKTSPSWLHRYFEMRDDGYHVTDELRRKVTFRHHDLSRDPFQKGFDLIVCRNVVIYFTREIKERLYRRFHSALRPGGVLFVGGTEVMSKTASQGFEMVDISFYRRNGVKQRWSARNSAQPYGRG